MAERRHFTRIFYLTAAKLTQGVHQWRTQLVDRSEERRVGKEC